jgi:hypothetical protein
MIRVISVPLSKSPTHHIPYYNDQHENLCLQKSLQYCIAERTGGPGYKQRFVFKHLVASTIYFLNRNFIPVGTNRPALLTLQSLKE